MEGKSFSYLCVLLGIVAGVCAGPLNVQEAACAKECRIDQNTLQYEVGKTYVYGYEADTVTTLQGSSDDHSSIHVRASAEIEVLAPCELVLSLRDVTLENSDPRDLTRFSTSENQGAFKKALENRPLRFAFQNGRVESICAAEDEPQWTLNIKRGVLSAIQNSMRHLETDEKIHEIDVAGECETDYKVSNNGWSSLTISKSKNLLGCTGRTNAITSLQTSPYSTASDIQSLPLLKSAHSCEQTISKSGLLQKSECHESHVFRPFSNKGSGAATTVRQVLQYKSEHDYVTTRNAPAGRRTTLTFEHTSEDGTDRNIERVTQKLQEICSSEDIRPATPRLFSELVFSLKPLDIYNLQSVHNRVERSRVCSDNHDMAKQFFHDALPAMGTTASVSLMQKLILSGEVTGAEASMWLTSLAFISNPTSEMLIQIKPLLDNAEALLPVSSMVHTLCKVTADCRNDVDVRDIVRTLTDSLGYNCKGDRHTILVTLKALGNIGVPTGAMETIARCASEANPTDVRLAALDAYRRMDCDINREELASIYRNAEEDTEVRIVAYLGLMQCPSEDVISLVRSTLAAEEVNQVGSFVWTHLTNIKESAGHFKQEAKEILEDETLKAAFNMDARKFSRNYEGSFFFDSLNTGAMAEGNLIWSSKSFIPRSANLNLTVDLFGHSMNLFEVGGRVEGLESYLEAFFGPGGYFPENAISDALKRQHRASSNRLNNLFDKYDAQMDEFRASAFFKVFGNELGYLDSDAQTKRGEFNFLEFLIKLAQEHQMEYTKSFMFLDSELHIPTIIGMPLKLCVNGTATVDVKVQGKLDVRKLGTSPSSLDISGYIKPSGAVEISGEMSMDATFSRSGLKMVSTLHSSTELNGIVQLQESKILNVKFNMPKEQMEVIDVQTKFFILSNEHEREQQMENTPRVQKKTCTGNGLYTVLGLQLCGEASYPVTMEREDSPYFPFTGPVDAALILHRRDTHQSYEFQAQIESKKEHLNGAHGISNIVHFAFNTPGSAVDRELYFDFNLNRLTKNLNAELRTPWKKATATGAITTEGNTKSVSFTTDVDEEEVLAISGELQKVPVDNGYRYVPSAEVRFANMKPFLLRGTFTCQPGQLHDAQLSIENVFSKDILLKGSIEKQGENDRARYSTEAEIQTPVFNTKATGFIANKEGVFRSRLEVNYDFDTKETHKIVLSGKYRNQSKRDNLQYRGSMALQSTQFSQYQFEVDTDFQKNEKHMESNFEMIYGPNPEDNSKRIIFKQEANIDQTDVLKFDHSMNLKIKPFNIIMSSRIDHTFGANEIKSNGKFSYKPGKEISLDVVMKREVTDLVQINGNMVLSMPNRELRIVSQLEETAKNSFNHEVTVQWQKNAQFRAVTAYVTMPSQNRHELKTEIYPPGMERMMISGEVVLNPIDLHAKLQSDLFGHSYGTSIGYNIELGAPNKAMGASFDIFYPERRIAFETKIDGAKGEYRLKSTTKWDADKDETKQVTITGTSSNLDNANLKINIPGRKITMSLRQRITDKSYSGHGDLSWATDKSISIDTDFNYKFGYYKKSMRGSVSLATPFQHMEHFKMALDHSNDRKDASSKLDVTYAPDKTISTSLSSKRIDGWKQMETSLIVTTPFHQMATMSITSKHALSDNNMSADVAMKYNDKYINADIVADNLERNRVDLTGNLESNIENLSSAGFKVHHDMQPTTIESRVEGRWMDETVVLTFSGSNTGKKGKENMQGKLEFISPFTNDLHVEAQHKDNGVSYNTMGEISWDHNKKITVTNGMSLLHNARRIKTNGNFVIHTPFTNAERLSLKWDHDISDSKVAVSKEMEWNQQKITISSENTFSYPDNLSIVSSTSITTTLDALKDLTIAFTGVARPSTVKGSLKIDHNTRNSVALELDLSHEQMRNFKGQMELGSRHFETIKSEISINTLDATKSAKVDISWGRDKVVLETTSSAYGVDEIKADIRLITTFRGVERIYASLDHVRKGTTWETKTNIEYGAKRFSSESSLQFSPVRMTVDVNTPFKEFRSIKYTMEHIGNDRFNGNSNLNVNGDTNIAVTYMLNGNSASEFRADFNNQYGIHTRHGYDGNEIEVSGELKLDQDKKINIETKYSMRPATFSIGLKTPYAVLSSIEALLSFNGDYRRFNTGLDLSVVTTPGEVKITSKLQASQLNYLDGNIDIKTPFDDFRSMSVDVSHKNQPRQLESTISLVYPYRKKIELSINMDKMQTQGTLSLKTPFTHDILVSAGLSSDSIQTNIKYDVDKIIDVKAAFQYEEKISATFTLTSPYEYVRYISCSFVHTGQAESFTSNLTMDYDRFEKPLEGIVSFDLKDMDLATSVSVSSPFEAILDASLHFSNKKISWKKYETNLKNTHNGRSIIDFKSTMKFVHIGNFNGDLEMTTKFPLAETVSLTFRHRGEPTRFTNQAEFSLNGEKTTYTGDFRTDSSTNGEFKLNERSVSFNQEGSLRNFASKAQVTYEQGNTIATSISWAITDNIEAKIEFSAPFSRDIIATVTHKGEIDNFSHITQVSYGRKTNTVTGRFQLTPTVIAQFKLESPYCEDTEVLFTHDGSLKVFQTTGSVRYGNRMIEGTADIDVRSEIKAKVTVNTPFRNYESMALSLEHNGNLSPFKFATTAEVEYATSKKMSISAKCKLVDGTFNTNLKLVTPFQELKESDISLVFRQQSNVDFNLDIDASINSIKKVEAHADLQTVGQVSGNLRLVTPIQGLEAVSLTFTAKGNSDKFQSSSIISYVHGEIRTEIAFEKTPMTVSISLMTPYEEARDVSVKFTHAGSVFNFNTDVSFEHNSLGKYSYTGQFNARRRINGEFTIQTPLDNYANIYARFSHMNQQPEFKSEVEVGIGSNVLKANAELSIDSNIQARMTLQTPFTQVTDFMVVFTKEGHYPEFEADVKVVLNRQNMLEASATLKLNEEIEGNINVISQLGTHSLSFSHSTENSRIATTGTMIYPGGKLGGELMLQIDPSVDGHFRFYSPCPYVRDLTITVKNKMNRSGFNSEITIDHDYSGKFSVAAELKLKPKIIGSASMETPYKEVRQITINFGHEIDNENYKANAEAKYNDMEYIVSGNVDLKQPHASLYLATPHNALRNLKVDVDRKSPQFTGSLTYNRQQLIQGEGSITYNPLRAGLTLRTQNDHIRFLSIEANHQDNNQNIRSSGSITLNEKKMINGEYTLKLGQSIEGSMKFETACPYMDAVSAQFNHQGDLSSFVTQGEVTYSNDYKYGAQVEFTRNPLQGKINLKTPHDGARDTTVSFNHNGGFRKFKSQAEVSGDFGTFSADGSFQARPLRVICSLTTPFASAQNMKMMLKHKGDNESFTSHAEASMDNSNWEADVKFTSEPLDANIQVNTPIRGYRRLGASVTQSGNTGHAEVTVQNTKVEADGFLQLRPLNANVAIKTPFSGIKILNAAIQHDGDLKSFSSRAEAGYENGKFSVGCAYSSYPLQGSFNVQTPFNGANNINLAFNQEGQTAHIEGSCDYGKIEADGRLEMNPINGEIHIQTPFNGARNLRATVKHQRKSVHADASYDYGKYEADGSYTTRPMSGNIEVKTPHTGLRSLKGGFRYQEGAAHVEASHDNGKYEGDMSYSINPLNGNLEIKTPHAGIRNMMAGFNYQKGAAHAEASHDHGKYEADVSYSVNPLKGNIEIKTPHAPVRVMKAGFSHQGSFKDFMSSAQAGSDNYQFEANVDFKINPMQGQVTLKTPFQGAQVVRAAFNHQITQNRYNTHGEASYDYGKYEADSSVQLDPLTLEVNAKTPHRGFSDVRAAFSHSSNQGGFEALAEASADNSQLSADASFKKFPLTGKFNVRAPKVNAALTFSGNSDAFQANIEGAINSQKAEAAASFTSQPLSGQFTMKTPFRHARSIKASMQHEGDMTGFNTQAMVGNENGEFVFQSNAQRRPLEAKVSMKTPISGFEEIGLELSHKGSLNKAFKSSASVQYQTGKTVSIAARYKNMRRILADLEVKTPFRGYEKIGASLRHNADSDDLSSSLELTKGKKAISANLDLKLSAAPNGKITIKTPFTGIEDISIGLNHQFDGRSLATTASLATSQGDVSVSVNGQFADMHNMQGSITAITPYQGMTVEASTQGTATDIRMEAKVTVDTQVTAAEVHVQTLNGLKISSKLSTPYVGYEDMELQLDHTSSYSEFETTGSLRIGHQMISTTAQLETERQIRFTANIQTPFQSLRKGSVTISHAGSARQFRTNIRTSLNDEKPVIFGVTYVNDRQLQINLEVKCPYAEDVTLSLVHEGILPQFTTEAVIKNSDGESAWKVDFQGRGKLSVVSELHSPYLQKPFTVNVDNEGTWDKFESVASVNDMRVEIKWSMEGNAITLNTGLQTPYNDRADGEFTFTGDMANFQATSTIAYSKSQKIEAQAALKSENGIPVNVQASLKTPFNGAENMALNMRTALNGGRFSTRGSVSWAERRAIKFQGSGSYSYGSPTELDITGSLSLNTPFSAARSLELVASHAHSSSALSSKIDLAINNEKLADAEIKISPRSGNVEIREPHRARAAFEIQEQAAFADVHWDTDDKDSVFRIDVTNKDDSTNYRTSKAFSIKSTSSSRVMSITADLEKSSKGFLHKASFAWDAQQQREVSYAVELNDKSRRGQNVYDATVRLNTPVRSMELLGSHSGDTTVYTSSVEWRWDAARDASRKMAITKTFQRADNRYTEQIVISHPSLIKDISLRNTIAFENEAAVSFRAEVVYSDNDEEKMVMSARAEARDSNYTMSLDVQHLINGIDLGISAHAANKPDVMSAGANIRYMNSVEETENYRLFGEIQKTKKALKFEISSPTKSFDAQGEITSSADTYSAEFSARADKEEVISCTATLNTDEGSLTAQARNFRDDSLTVSGKYNSPINMGFEAYREQNGRRIPESNLSIDLKNKRLIHTRMYVRPGISRDIRAQLTSLLYRARRQAERTWESSTAAISDEVQAKVNNIRRLPDVTSFEMFSDADTAAFQRDVQVIRTSWRRMFYNDEFFMKTIYRSANRAIEAFNLWSENMMIKMKITMQKYMDEVAEVAADIHQWCSDVCENITRRFQRLHKRATFWINSRNRALYAKLHKVHLWALNNTSIYRAIAESEGAILIEKFVDFTAPLFNAYYNFQRQVTSWVNTQIEIIMGQIVELIERIPHEEIERCIEMVIRRVNQYKALVSAIIQQNQKIFHQMMEKISEYEILRPIYNAHLQVAARVEGLMVRLAELAENPVATAHALLVNTRQTMEQMTNEMLAAVNNDYIRGVLEHEVEKARWVYTHYELESKIIYAVKQTTSHTLRFIKDTALYMVNDYLGLEKDRLMVYNPEGGELEFELYVPSGVPQITLPVNYDAVRELYSAGVDAADDLYQSLPSPYDYSMCDMFQQYKPDMNPANWIPPFTAYAAISGDQQIMTFDKKFYDFAGNCDYVLASDFVDGNFTIVANYKDGKRTAVTVMTNGQEIEISDVAKVNGEDSELPYEFTNTTVTRAGDVIDVVSTLGFTVTCDVRQNFCYVSISGWYYGKTAGLFGTYTNEPSDDMMTSDHKVTQNQEEFAQSWSVGRCEQRRNYAVAAAEPEHARCDKIFRDEQSSMRRCFKVVEPADFYNMCVTDVTQKAAEGECRSAALYRLICSREAGVQVDMPEQCSACSKPISGELAVSEEMTVNSPPQSADVVFVVEERACNLDAATRLASLATKIDLELHNAGLKNTRFGLVAYGGSGVHTAPHSHTVGGQILGDARKMRFAFQSLVMDGAGESDALAAVTEAADYPFRAGVSKSIVLVTCGVCEENRVEYEEVAEVLEDMDITLHVLSEYEFAMAGESASPKTNYLFGIDDKTAFTVKHVRDPELAGDPALFAKLMAPDTRCAAMAQETGGSFFNIKKLTEGRVRFQKSFSDIFSRRVAKDAVPAACQQCECVFTNSGAGQTVCTPCIQHNPIKQLMLEGKLDKPEQVYTKPIRTRGLRVRKNKREGRKTKKARTML